MTEQIIPSGFLAEFPVFDAHQHFWDPQENYHPWLSDEPMIYDKLTPYEYLEFVAREFSNNATFGRFDAIFTPIGPVGL